MTREYDQTDRTPALRGALGQFPTGVAVVTARGEDGEPIGMTVNSFNSVSLSPPLVAWCIDRQAASHDAFAQAQSFAITVLARDQSALAMRFATRGAKKFHDIDTSGTDVPLIPQGCAWFHCQTCRAIPLGDHTMLIGRVTGFARNSKQPLVFQNGQFQQLAEFAVQVAA